MKTKFVISILALMAFVSLKVFCQHFPTYPIPSYNIPLDSLANFAEKSFSDQSAPTDGKREMNVQIRPKVLTGTCSATVWVYSLDRTTILGPYDIVSGQVLSVEIDDREWGVLVESEDEVIVDVWIE